MCSCQCRTARHTCTKSDIRIRIRREQEGKDLLTRNSGGRNVNQMLVSINSTSVQYWSDIVTLLINFWMLLARILYVWLKDITITYWVCNQWYSLIQGIRVKYGLSCMIGPLGRQGLAATLRQLQMTRRRLTTVTKKLHIIHPLNQ